MAEYTSGQLSFGGLTENTDFQGLRAKLKTIEMGKANRLYKWRSDWQTRIDAFQTVRTQMVTLQSKLKTMNTVDKFLVKNASTSQETVAKATAGSKSSTGVYNVEVNKLANYASWSLQTTYPDKNAVLNNTATLGDFTYTYKGKSRAINVPKDTTLQGLVNMINNDSQNPGVVAQLVPGQGGMLFQLRSKDTGSASTLSIDSINGVAGMTVNSTPRWGNPAASTDMLSQYFGTPTDLLNPSASPMTFSLTRSTVAVPPSWPVSIAAGGTLADLVTAVNAQTGTTGVTATIGTTAEGGKRIVLSSGTAGETFTLAQDSAPGTGTMNNQVLDDFSQEINPNDTPRTFVYSVNGTDTTITLGAHATLRTLYDAVNSQTATTGVRAVTNVIDGVGVTFSLQHVDGDPVTIGSGTLNTFSNTQDVSNWNVAEGQNAEIRYNGWPADPSWLEVPSNTLTNMLDQDLTVNLYSAGKTTITVGIDSSSIQKNVEDFVEAVNLMRKTLQELTKFDSNKEVLKPEYANSQFEMQKGAVLTGNYGVQMISSRMKSICAGSAVGFTPRKVETDPVTKAIISDTGDFFNSLSQIGIMTNSTQGSDMYGLLEINMGQESMKSSLTLEAAIKKNPEAVAKLFSAANEGYSSDARFGHVSHIDSITKPGQYDVKYSIDALGAVTGTINGKTMVKGEGNTYGVYSSDPPPNAADGMLIEIYDLTPSTSVSSKVGIRQGKVNELLSTMDGSEGFLGKNGTLSILENNYKGIIKNIDEKLSKEDDRIIKWERNIKARFSRLESVIAQYQKMNADVKSQIAQLKSNG